jgi:hypothetical protein
MPTRTTVFLSLVPIRHHPSRPARLSRLFGVNSETMPYITGRERPADGVGQGRAGRKDGRMIGWLFRILAVLVLLGAVGLVGFAYLGDLAPVQERVRAPVMLPLDPGPPGAP